MTWTLHRWVWRLEAPLFIGMPPAGALNRCRLYVPARTLWGALTAELARLRCENSFPGDDYKQLGEDIVDNCRFTYLYPAKKIGDKFLAWLPEYESGRGLVWRRQAGTDPLPDRKFRQLLLDTRPGTAIEPETDSAFEGTLRQTECITPWWWELRGRDKEPKPVYLAGYFFMRKDSLKLKHELSNINTLFIGGDTRYGLGKISKVPWDDVSADGSVFGQHVYLNSEDPEIASNTVLGHALLEKQEDSIEVRGMKELLGGWDRGTPWKGNLMWVPGSVLKKQKNQVLWRIDKNGHWRR